MVLSYPEVRQFVAKALAQRIAEDFPQANRIAGIATAGIAHGVLAAEELNMSYCYVRPEPKKHGLKNQVEGFMEAGDRVVLVEDLISTGKSSLQAVDGVRNEGAEVVGLVALFTYGFESAKQRFAAQGIPVFTLSNFDTLCEVAADEGYISPEELEDVKRFATDPESWGADK